MHQNGNHSFVAYLSDNEFGNLCRKLGILPLPLDALSFYGLDLLDLGRDVLVAQAVPKMVQSFVRAQMKGESLDAELILKLLCLVGWSAPNASLSSLGLANMPSYVNRPGRGCL